MANINRLKAWVRYDGKGRLVGGGPILQADEPKNGDWVEIDSLICCGPNPSTVVTTKKLKAFVRYANGKVVAGSMVMQAKKPAVGKWEEIPMDKCCNSTTSTTTSTTTVPPLGLRLLFIDINEVDAVVGDSSDVSDWNSYFNLPALGSPFTSVQVTGNEVKLYGGSNIKVKPALMYNEQNFLIELDDEIGCITSVGGDAFSYSQSLTTVSLPACTIVYGSEDSPQGDWGGFGECINLVNVNIPNLTTVGTSGFILCSSITSLNFPLLTSAGNFAFEGCTSLQSVNFPILSSVINSTFRSCSSLSSISLPLVTSIGDNMFNNCISLTSVSLPLATSIGQSSFNTCTSLVSITLPQALTCGFTAFSGCTNLTTVSLPVLTSTLGAAFVSCTSLTNISLPSCTSLGPTVGNNAVFNVITGNTITLTIPASRMTANGGNPDGDIQYLQANNTVTVITT